MHDFVVEALKALRTCHLSYRAAFRHPKRKRLPLLRVPVLVCASVSDMLHAYAPEVAALVPGARAADLPDWHAHGFEDAAADLIQDFLTGATQ